jgi:hypothetical protein
MSKKNVIDAQKTLARAFKEHTDEAPDEVDVRGRRVRMCYREPWGTSDVERIDCFERPLSVVVKFLRECRNDTHEGHHYCDRGWTRDFAEGKYTPGATRRNG